MPFYIHMGMVYVPFGYQFPEMSNNAYSHGMSPYGSSTIANGDGSRKVLEQESAAAQQQGKVGKTLHAKNRLLTHHSISATL